MNATMLPKATISAGSKAVTSVRRPRSASWAARFPALDAMREGYETYPVVDAIGGTSVEAHRAGLERVYQAGAQPISWVSLAFELQRDWAREATVPEVTQIVFTERLLQE